MVLAGDRGRFRELVERYQQRIFALSLRLVGNPSDAEDMAQQAFVEAFSGLASFDLRRSFITWLVRIAVNNCKDHLKSHKRRERQLGSEVETDGALFSGKVPGPEQALAARQQGLAVAAALGHMDPKYRVPLVLKDIEGQSYEEMKQVLDLPVTTLKIRVVRAREQLQEALNWMLEKN